MHVTLHLFGLHRRIGQRHVEVGLGCVRLKGPRRIHAGKSGGAHERRRLFENRPHIRWNGHNVMRADEAHQSVKGSAKGIQQMIGRGMILAQFFKHCAWSLCPALVHSRLLLKCS